MKHNLLRTLLGIKNIRKDKWMLIYPTGYLIMLFIIWSVFREHVPTFNYFSLPNLYIYGFTVYLPSK